MLSYEVSLSEPQGKEVSKSSVNQELFMDLGVKANTNYIVKTGEAIKFLKETLDSEGRQWSYWTDSMYELHTELLGQN